MKLRNYFRLCLWVGIVVLIVSSCSAKRNTAKSRFWQSFTAKYNTYYNGAMAYIDGSLEKEQQNQDNFTELIPLYYVGNKGSVSLGATNFDRAIEKSEKAIKLHSIKKRPVWNKKRRKTDRDIEWLNRREYNPMLWKAWLLLGRSQFHKGEFDASAATFSYMSRLYQTQPAIYAKARAWLAKAYVEADWLYDAEDVIRNMSRDSIHWSAQKEWNYTYADYYIHVEEYDKAIFYLKEVIKHEGRRKQKAREYFLLGQLYALTNERAEAYKSYKRVIRQHPPYELQFNARIAMTEVMAQGNVKRMISKLKSMARSDNNKEFLDQVYYAMGNIYMTQKDTLSAMSAYEKGNEKSVRNGIEKGVLLLRLGDIYWDMEKFSDAARCYGEAIGLLDKDRKDYAQLAERSQKLDQLVPFTEAIHLEDSLQELALMSEKDRNDAIDRVIEALKKKEKEERDAEARAAAEETIARNSQTAGRQNNANTSDNGMVNGTWYFYNSQAVNQGKQSFQRQWGRRDNVDHWQRSNRTVVDFGTDEEDTTEYTEEQLDSIRIAQEDAEALENKMDSAVNDPHKREYYLAQIPFTEEQKAASDLTIMDALYNSGVIFKDKLDKLNLSERQFQRLMTQYPTYEGMDNAYYHLFLLYSRLGLHQIADSYVARLKAQFPESQWTTLLSDPYFADNQRFGIHMEDSLYAATYDAFKNDHYGEIKTNVRLSNDRFPLGANRDKFIFIGGLGKLNSGDVDGCLTDMNTIVTDFPDSKLAEMAGMILNGVKQGRQLRGGRFDIGDVWTRRAIILNDEDSLMNREFSAEPDVEFYFMVAYEPDSVNGNQLLYQLAKFNFTNYLVRNFDMEVERQEGLNVIRIGGFNSYYEAREYAQEFYRQENIRQILGASRTYIISRENLSLLGTRYSYEDYEEFYAKHFEPLRSSDQQLLLEPSSQRSALDDGGSMPGNISPILQQQQESEHESDEDYVIPENEGVIIIEDEDLYDNAITTEDAILIDEMPEGTPPYDEADIVIEEEFPAESEDTYILEDDERDIIENVAIFDETLEENGETIDLPIGGENVIVVNDDEIADDGNVIMIEESEAADSGDTFIVEDEFAPNSDENVFDDEYINDEEIYDDDENYFLDDDTYDIDDDINIFEENIIVIYDDDDIGIDDEYYDLDGF